jgi:hypothetical protein
MTVQRYSNEKDRTAQGSTGSGGMVINRRCNDCKKPVGTSRVVYRLLDYCAACHAAKTGKVAA